MMRFFHSVNSLSPSLRGEGKELPLPPNLGQELVAGHDREAAKIYAVRKSRLAGRKALVASSCNREGVTNNRRAFGFRPQFNRNHTANFRMRLNFNFGSNSRA